MRAQLVMILCCLAATGCASSMVHPTPYPADWPERSGRSECRIAGAYQDVGDVRAISGISPGQRHAHLSSLLREGNTGPFDDSSNPDVHVWLDRDSPRMHVNPDGPGKAEQLRSEGGVVCETDGALTLKFESVTARSYRHAAVTVWDGEDGSLIVRMGLSFTEKGLPGLLPDSHEVFWFRFPRTRGALR